MATVNPSGLAIPIPNRCPPRIFPNARYEQHTLKCSSCKKAHKTFEALQKVSIGAAVVLCAAAGVPPDIQLRLLFAVLAVFSAGLVYFAHELQKNFVFVDYVHAEIE